MRWLALWFLALMCGCQAEQKSTLGVDALRGIGIDQRIGEKLPLDASFVNAEGRSVRLGELFGERPVVLALIYNECPMLCNQVLHGLVASLKVLRETAGQDFDVLAVSFDPRETPAQAAKQKRAMLDKYGRGDFHFLTGDEASIARLTEAAGFRYEYDAELEQYAHASAIMVVTPSGEMARYFYGTEYAPKDLRLGLIEASAGKLGDLSDELVLMCYRYDPIKGSYGASAVVAMRIGGALTILTLAVFVMLSLRRERRRAKETAA